MDWFNNRRLLEPIGNIPPAEAELRHAGTTCHGGVTQTKWLPTNPIANAVKPTVFAVLKFSRLKLFSTNAFCFSVIEQQQSRSNQSGQSQLQRGLCRQLSCHVSCAVDSSGIEPAAVLNKRRPRVSSSSSLNG